MRVVIAVLMLVIILVAGAVLDMLATVNTKLNSVAPWSSYDPLHMDPYHLIVLVLMAGAAALVVYIALRIATAIRERIWR